MKLAVSNIAWPPALDESAAGLMNEFGIKGVEIAPTAVWADPLSTGREEALRWRGFWEQRGIQVVAMQALLFGRPDLVVFGPPEVRQRTLEHLEGMMRLANWLGARVLVFGSPKNRLSAGLDPIERDRIATAFFRSAGERAQRYNVALCIEANPPEYGCDYVTRTDEALELVRRVDDAGFGLHLDAGGMSLSQEPPAEILDRCAGAIRHFHASEPFLGVLGTGGSDHRAFAGALRRQEYGNWVSVEMRQAAEGAALQHLGDALAYLVGTYG